ncbi:2-amino-4-hydroxy-6-hydroxymethyldihydropteridine diphosphokinase [Clostridium sp. CM028]|uniref:2-amino-4-hydroxy-6- hydroxymethyldihydropteridine diphosphokinase n=1 Tax=unclassified Clostridium TaxID=2614128 RepID=UPI001C6EADCB|nr:MULTISPECIES: 2-amino-4-hydroxy-6-hydroxymethyldihydropteridine diphosphokinase [unclassified Clostridium]MBW9144365.1 2-amino-4-hydroxy-6-hydroxymethyldihydropteridine diphosphokinase [Clostridium sp. CM027]MBW9149397.1 2-amino-4-hydroxy-6-hydroxymethyldihydropteridine diphosphokinase [Clostridium sp. CM028]UVE41005.1 2-amino-4-hydroxy-6-hydroxymethyldihydropteridine diphosphokinase [Clostridium sp. CM027]WLC61672.1 2-amino-4-hydroxy-6-hydroxymethyldihydropteridine diphosphokinase [Clostrid
MDKMYIKDLEVYGHHGVFKEEKTLGQRFLISLELFLSLREAGITDDLTRTVHYGELCQLVEEEFNKESYDLIEKATEKLAEFILLKYDLVQRVKVKIKKPWAPIGKPLQYAAVEIDRKWHTAYIGIGGNMGDKEKNVKESLELINNSYHTQITKTSKFYETKPVGYLEQDDFLNCAIEIKTLLNPLELVRFLLSIEKELKRERVIRWGPRTVDLDVLLYDDIISSLDEIILPHPRMQERMFVLEPLCDIAPYVMHPILNKSIIEIKASLKE